MDPDYVVRTRASYDQVAGDYATRFIDELAHKPLDRALLACFAELTHGRGRVADIGCGPGQLAGHLHRQGVDVIGIDLSPQMIAVAQRHFPAVPFQQGSMLNLPLGDASLAGITAFYAIIHLSPTDRPAALREFHRVLQPAGVLLLSFHIGEETVHLDEWWEQPVNLDFQFIRPATLTQELEAAGFTVEGSIERRPYEPLEHPSRRGYILARKHT